MFQLITCPTLTILKSRWEFTIGLITCMCQCCYMTAGKEKDEAHRSQEGWEGFQVRRLNSRHYEGFVKAHHYSFQYAKNGGFPGSASVKESTCQCRRWKRFGFTPSVKKIPGTRSGNPLQYSYLENPMKKGAWWDTVTGVTEVDTIEQLSMWKKKKRATLLLSQYSLWKYHLIFSKGWG